ncbi:LCP family glycopolymer transferase [Actinomadura rupiterrae]|uniref:LCP family glycopolymer transferase n=1 Tax=Actinomadura rupiterrae TaxID=559627 RepID=UPI0020A5C4FC|nr:LCP family protein [Actinomadura rupiterrae]MCP2340794.1 LCP family protein required for cell wall assembly [Actinomadura rupiterrae]
MTSRPARRNRRNAEAGPGPDEAAGGSAGDPGDSGSGGLPRALGLTAASTLVWGVAHLCTGRRRFGGTLVGLFVALVVGLAVWYTVYRPDLLHLAVRPDLLSAAAAGMLVVGLVWLCVIIRSYQITRPGGMSAPARTAGAAVVAVLCFAVAVPVSWAAHTTYVARSTLTSIFHAGGTNGAKEIDASDPWNGQSRVNVLLLGSDSAYDREGTRTDSMTVASVDTKTGETVLLGMPRNLEHFQMPPGPARDRFPDGFTGDGPETPGLLNEVFQYAEDHPDMVPGVAKNHRGPTLLKQTLEGILHQRIDYYIMVDMFGFADIVDAVGGVKIKITQPIPYGLQGGVLQPGDRVLHGKEALWYGRSRTDSDDYTRMGRQKCLLRAIARQADPTTVLTRFDKLAEATKRAISTDIPQELLPALVKLSEKVKDGAQISTLAFVPPLISTGNPDFALIRKLAAKVMESNPSPSPSPSGSPSGSPSDAASPAGSGSPSASPSDSPSESPSDTPSGSPSGSGGGGTDASGHDRAKPISLDSICPS